MSSVDPNRSDDPERFDFLDTPERNEMFEAARRHHLSTPGVTLEQYLLTKCLALGRQVNAKKKVYLDLKYWIYLRDVMIGRSSDTQQKELYNVLLGYAAEGRVVCPLSDHTWLEVWKQEDPDTRVATARVMDKLSKGVTLRSTDERVEIEMTHFLLTFSPPENEELFCLANAVWTKIGYVLGHHFPASDALPQERKAALMKCLVDGYWTMSFEEQMILLGSREASPPYSVTDIEAVNDARLERANEVKSYEDAYRQELAGIISSHVDVRRKVQGKTYTAFTGKQATNEDLNNPETMNLFQNLIYGAILKAGMEKTFPTITVNTALFAEYRVNKRRKFEPNDISTTTATPSVPCRIAMPSSLTGHWHLW